MFAYYPLGEDGGSGGALNVAITPEFIERYSSDPYVSGNYPAAANVTGGTGVYTFKWKPLAGSDPKIVIDDYTAQYPHFRCWNESGTPGTFYATWEVTVSDGVSTATDSFDVTIGMGVPPP